MGKHGPRVAPVSPEPRSGATRRALGVLLGLAAVFALGLPSTGAAQAATCQTSTAPSGSYWVTVCFQAPTSGQTLSGVATISVSVSVGGSAPTVQEVGFTLDGQHLVTDFEAPYTFSLPTTKFVDGSRTLAASALMKDRYRTQQATLGVSFLNHIYSPPVNRNTFTPPRGTTPPAGQPFTLAAVGDGAGGTAPEVAVANMVGGWQPNLFLYLGDVYAHGSSTEFHNWYGDETRLYGRLKSVTAPSVGNHEYDTPGAAGYFDYWDNPPAYYSFDAAGWHFISLDSNDSVSSTSAQYQWLAQDLGASRSACTLAFFHHPTFDVGQYTATVQSARLTELWGLLARSGVDIVLNGHIHTYQRWRPLNATGAMDPNGMTEFIAATGGHELVGLNPSTKDDPRLAAAFAGAPNAYGALRFSLTPDSAGFNYITSAGSILDSGTVNCSVPPPVGPDVFRDAFDVAGLSAWTASGGLSVQNSIYRSGPSAAAGYASKAQTWARKRLSSTLTEVYERISFRIDSQRARGITLFGVGSADGREIGAVYLSSSQQLGLRNDVTGASVTGATKLAFNTWYTLDLHVIVNGTTSTTEVSLNGLRLSDLSTTGTASLGTTPVGEVQLGEISSIGGASYAAFFDDVVVQRTPF